MAATIEVSQIVDKRQTNGLWLQCKMKLQTCSDILQCLTLIYITLIKQIEQTAF